MWECAVDKNVTETSAVINDDDDDDEEDWWANSI